MTRLLLLDNHDSFTWNLAQYLEELGADVQVRLNDEVSVDWCVAQRFDALVISPGPGRPEHAGISMDLIRRTAGELPVLGVCLGHQALARCYGAQIVHAPTVVHGKTSPILHDGSGIFADLPPAFEATRYHSLIIDEPSLHEAFAVTARCPAGVIMGIQHRALPLYGVQFHPESVLTAQGKPLLNNFLSLAGSPCRPG